jgi:CHAT domain-containing protein/Tfp pilus assembly protein PilF
MSIKCYKIKSILIVVFFLTIQIVEAQNNSKKRQLNSKYLHSLTLIGNKEFDQAISILKDIIENEPQISKAYIKIAQVYRKKKDDAGAIAYFHDLIVKNPNNSYANHSLGWMYLVTKEYDKAIEFCMKSIELNPKYAEGIKDFVNVQQKLNKLNDAEIYLKSMIKLKPKNFSAYYGLGYLYQLQHEWEKALQNINKAVELKKDLLLAYVTKGVILWYTNRYQDFLEMCQTALSLSENKNDLELQVNFLTNIGLAQSHFSNNAEALKNYEQALAIAKKIGYRKEVMRISGNMGVIYRDTGQLELAAKHFEKAYLIANEMGNTYHQGLQLRNIGDCYHFMGKYNMALEYLNKATPIIESLGNTHLESLLYWSLGMLNSNYGNQSDALAYNRKALNIAIQQDDKFGIERYLNSIGLNYLNLGNYSKALKCFKESLPISKEIGDRFGEGLTMGHIAIIYQGLSDYKNALKCYDDALIIAREMNNKNEEMRHLANIGTVYGQQGNYEEALKYYKKALGMAREFKDKRQESILLANIGDAYILAKNFREAKRFINRALSLSRDIGDKSTQASQLLNLGDVNKSNGNYNEALKCYSQANQLGKKLNALELNWRSYMGIGVCYERQKKYQQSLTSYRYAIDEIEKIRGKITTDKLKTSFFEDKLQLYVNIIKLLYRLNKKNPSEDYKQKAFWYAEKAKARTLLDIVFEGKIFQNLSEIPVTFRQKFLINETKYNNKQNEISAELSKSGNIRDSTLISQLSSEIETLQAEKTKILLELQKKYPRYYQLTNPNHLTGPEVQKRVLKDDEIIIKYLVADDEIFVWLISKNQLKFQTIDLSKKELETWLADISPIFAKGVVESQIDYRWANFNFDLLHKLYIELLEKPAAQFLDKTKNLIIIPDDLLYYFPFEILVTKIGHNSVKYLVEDYAISYSSSASMLNPELHKKRNAQNDLLAFGNPDFQSKDKNGFFKQLADLVKNRSFFRDASLVPLPNSEIEVHEIAKYFQKAFVLTGANAHEKRFKESAENYKFIHFATHFIVDDRQPMYSKIVLSQSNPEPEDGLLQTYEIYNMKLNADMVVLSGCNSGIGSLKRGEGLIGMTRAFLYAGVPSLVVSLWPVEDESTSMLMKQFYAYLNDGLNKRTALQKAKVDLIKSQNRNSDPFYWAPFVLIGDGD